MYDLVSGQNSAQPQSSAPKLTTLALVNVQLNTGLSNNRLKKLVKTVNETSSSKVVEPNFYMNFLRVGQHLSDFLKITDGKGDSGTVRVVAHCNDLSSLVNHIIQSSKISDSYFVKLRIDGGKVFLKFCLSIVDTALRDDNQLTATKTTCHSKDWQRHWSQETNSCCGIRRFARNSLQY